MSQRCQPTPAHRIVVQIEKEELEGNEQPLPRVGDFWEKGSKRFEIVRQRLLASGAIQFLMKEQR